MEQPDREYLDKYFGERRWPSGGPNQQMDLQECVAHGMDVVSGTNEVFNWLTATNVVAEEGLQGSPYQQRYYRGRSYHRIRLRPHDQVDLGYPRHSWFDPPT